MSSTLGPIAPQQRAWPINETCILFGPLPVRPLIEPNPDPSTLFNAEEYIFSDAITRAENRMSALEQQFRYARSDAALFPDQEPALCGEV